MPPIEERTPTRRPPPTDSLTTAPPTTRPERPMPYLPGIEFRFYDDAEQLAAAYRAGDLDAASGLPPATAAELGADAGSRAAALPGLDADDGPAQPAPEPPGVPRPAVRTALLEAIDRAGIIDAVVRRARGVGAAARSRPARRCSTRRPIRRSRSDAPRRRRPSRPPAGPRRTDGWHLARREEAARRSRCSARTQAPTRWPYAVAEAVAADWKALGLAVTHVGAAARRVRDRPAGDRRRSRRRSPTSRSASTPTSTRCSRRARPGPAARTSSASRIRRLDKLLAAAREPGTRRRAQGRVFGPPEAARRRADTCSRWPSPDEVVVVRDTRQGPVRPPGRRPG